MLRSSCESVGAMPRALVGMDVSFQITCWGGFVSSRASGMDAGEKNYAVNDGGVKSQQRTSLRGGRPASE